VISVALARGLRPGLGAASGILAANAFYFALSAAGVGAMLLASSRLFLAVKWAGAGYLIYVGVRMLLARAPEADAAAPAPPSAQSAGAAGGAFLKGLVVQGSNPKALVFFAALLPQFVDPGAPVAWQVGLLGASSVLIELLVLALYAAAAARARRWAGSRVATHVERAGGAFLVAAGARLALVRRP
jgi:threonine/homoserine/homoserine lactone efflux protein